MCEWFEISEEIFSVVELRERMIEKTGRDDDVYSVQTLKRKLIE